jgi:hypothetical protein
MTIDWSLNTAKASRRSLQERILPPERGVDAPIGLTLEAFHQWEYHPDDKVIFAAASSKDGC